MKTINNKLANENPSGTGLIVSNNTLGIWDAVGTTTSTSTTSTTTSSTTSTTQTGTTSTSSTTTTTTTTGPPSVARLVTFVISS